MICIVSAEAVVLPAFRFLLEKTNVCGMDKNFLLRSRVCRDQPEQLIDVSMSKYRQYISRNIMLIFLKLNEDLLFFFEIP